MSDKRINPRIENANIKMMLDKEYDLEFYGHFSQRINFQRMNTPGMTMGVTYHKGNLNLVYSEEFMESLSEEQLNFVLIHEFLHLLSNHVIRTKEANHEHQLANVAQDYVINEGIIQDICSKNNKVAVPDSVLRMPSEYKGQRIYEFVYMFVKDVEKKVNEVLNKNGVTNGDIEKMKNDIKEALKKIANSGGVPNNSKVSVSVGNNGQPGEQEGQGGQEDGGQGGQGQEEGEGQDGQGNQGNQGNQKNPLEEAIEKNKETADKIEKAIENDPYFNNNKDSKELNNLKKALARKNYNFDMHFTASPDEATIAGEKVKGIVNSLKSRGLMKGDIEAMLEGLYKTKVDYLKIIKKMATWIKGTERNRTYSKPNRRGFTNLKGKRKYASVINCILDTSGSMSGEFDMVLSHIFKDGYQINLIQCDTEVTDYKVVTNKNELKTLKIKGLGGTVLNPGLDFIRENNKLKRNNTLILTDGYTDTLDTSNLKKVLILTTGTESPVVDDSNVRQIIIDENELVVN